MIEESMTCYARDEMRCEDGMCLRTGCRLQNEVIKNSESLRASAPCTREPTDRELEERVARAICKADAGDGESIFQHMREYWTRVAKAAIAAMPPSSAATTIEPAPTRLTPENYAGLRDAAALEIWHRFADSGTDEWEDETHKAEYLMCADAILAHTFSLETVSPSTASSAEPVKCDCGFSADACKLNPCLRKKIHLAGMTPDSEWPNTGSVATPPSVGNADAVREQAFKTAEMLESDVLFDRQYRDFLAKQLRAALSAPVDGADILKNIHYALTKDSLCDAERVASARTIVSAAISRNDRGSEVR